MIILNFIKFRLKIILKKPIHVCSLNINNSNNKRNAVLINKSTIKGFFNYLNKDKIIFFCPAPPPYIVEIKNSVLDNCNDTAIWSVYNEMHVEKWYWPIYLCLNVENPFDVSQFIAWKWKTFLVIWVQIKIRTKKYLLASVGGFSIRNSSWTLPKATITQKNVHLQFPEQKAVMSGPDVYITGTVQNLENATNMYPLSQSNYCLARR